MGRLGPLCAQGVGAVADGRSFWMPPVQLLTETRREPPWHTHSNHNGRPWFLRRHTDADGLCRRLTLPHP